MIEQELSVAAEIQRGLFPHSLPHIQRYEMAARNRPARLCGGDYYDAFEVNPRIEQDAAATSLLLCVSDVAGKGLDAALLMSTVQATLHALAGRLPSLVELTVQLNQRIYESSPPNKFVTGILVEINPATGEGQYVNAGHNSCLLLRNSGDLDLLESTGLPLGMMPSDLLDRLGKQYTTHSIRLEAEDLLTLYTDGVPEAYNNRDEEWGEDRFYNCLRSLAGESASNIVDKLFAAMDEFSEGAAKHDDITLLVLKKL